VADPLRHDDLTIPQGTDFKVQWPLLDGDKQAIPSMTGWTARAQVRVAVTSTDTLASWTSADGGILLEDSSVTLIITNEQSTAWEWANGVYDVEVITPTGEVTRITQGRFFLDREVTR